MSVLYPTSDYVRDSFWFIDSIFNFIKRFKTKAAKILSEIFEHDFESYIFRFIENIPLALYFSLVSIFLILGLLRVTERGTGIKTVTILTNSMKPAIIPGSIVFASQSGSYKFNDIVIYKERGTKTNEFTGRNLAHRIIEVKKIDNNNVFTLKGDNNQNPDPGEVSAPDVLGKVFLILPYLGYIDFLVTTLPGFIIFLAIPTVIVIFEAKKYATT